MHTHQFQQSVFHTRSSLYYAYICMSQLLCMTFKRKRKKKKLNIFNVILIQKTENNEKCKFIKNKIKENVLDKLTSFLNKLYDGTAICMILCGMKTIFFEFFQFNFNILLFVVSIKFCEFMFGSQSKLTHNFFFICFFVVVLKTFYQMRERKHSAVCY